MNWKKIAKALLFPPLWLILPLIALSVAGLTWVFLNGLETAVVSYFIYVLSFYTLTVTCVFCALVLPKKQKAIRQKIYANPVGSRYMTDRAFRVRVGMHMALAINLLYVAVNLLSWYRNRSWWFIVLAVYYVILAVMYYLLVRYIHANEIGSNRRGELRRSILCSCILLTLNFVLSGAVLMILYQNKGFQYHGVLIYVMALFTFYQTTVAIIDMIKYRKFGSPVVSTAKAISLASALVSMLNLETAMFAEFGADLAEKHQRLFIVLTGAGVAVTVIAMSVYRIAHGFRELRDIKKERNP